MTAQSFTTPTRFSLTLPPDVDLTNLVGPGNEIIHIIEDAFDALVTVRGDTITFSGDQDQTQALGSLFGDMIKVAQRGQAVDADEVRNAIKLLKSGNFTSSNLREDVILTYRGRAIRPKTVGQKLYVDAMRNNTITFGIGPAGTGKTYLAMATAVAALKRKEVGRIILTRPVVEAGESLGFLPGTLMEKVDPYIRPLYDALYDMMDMEKANALLEGGVIEVAPLAFMRGRTLNDSFIILDEAQNTTPEQMKMFLTRLGFGSKMVVTGDITQLDLPKGISGLKSIKDILGDVDEIAFCDFTNFDVVRHSLVAAIVDAYEKHDEKNRVSHDDSRIRHERLKQDAGVAWAMAGSMHPTLVSVGKGERPKKDADDSAKKPPKKPEPFKPDTGVVDALLNHEMFGTLEKIYSKPHWLPDDLNVGRRRAENAASASDASKESPTQNANNDAESGKGNEDR